MIRSDDLGDYRVRLDNLGVQAKQLVERDLRQWASEHPQPDKGEDPHAHAKWVSSFRERSREVMAERSETFEYASATLAADLYDKLAADAGINAGSPTLRRCMTKERIRRITHYQAGKLAGGDIGGFIDQIGDACRDGVKQAARNTTMKGVESDAGKGRDVRFARVMRGAENCGFCFMLATRGFVYKSAGTAGALDPDHYHRGCNCDVVAGFGDGKSVEGYDLDGMQRRYFQAVGMLDRDAVWERFEALPESEKARYGKKARKGEDRFNGYWASKVAETLELMDSRWLYDGAPVKTDYSNNPIKNYGRLLTPDDYSPENIVDRGNEWRDLIAHDRLSRAGIKAQAMGGRDLDLLINGSPWEVKSPEAPSEAPKPGRELAFIERDLRKAVKQFEKRGMGDQTSVVMNTRYRNVASDEKVISEIKRQMEAHHVKRVIFISPSGDIRYITK